MAWHVFAASARGKSHSDAGLPCQDSFAYHVSGEVLVAVVCDGAGSARLSEQGSAFISKTVAAGLHGTIERGQAIQALPLTAFKRILERIVIATRRSLESMAVPAHAHISDYASTLVGVVTAPAGGYFFHIGDGLAVAHPAVAGVPTIVSPPENGGSVNETFFVTGASWRDHLRVVPMQSSKQHIVLMSDGTASFAANKTNTGLFRPFIDPIARYLETVSESQGSLALAATLDDARTHQITLDDKTLLIAHWS